MSNKQSQKITFLPEYTMAIATKKGEYNQLIFAVMLTFFEKNGRFPITKDLELPNFIHAASDYLQSEVALNECDWTSRTFDRFRQEIRFITGFRQATLKDKESFIAHCKRTIFPMAPTWDQALEQCFDYFKSVKLEPYSEKQLHRFLNAAHHQFESEFFEQIEKILSDKTKKALDQLVEDDLTKDDFTSIKSITLTTLKETRVYLKMNSVLAEIQKYKNLQHIELPDELMKTGTRKLLLKYYERVLVESPSHIRNHKASIRYAYLALFCHVRKQIMTDTLSDLLLKLLKRINTKAEKSIDKSLRLDHKRAKGKMGTLLILAQTSKNNPNGIIEKTIYPNVSKERLEEIVTDLGCDDNWYKNLIKEKALSLYSHNNRSLIWNLMDTLDFGADTNRKRLLIALNFLKRINAASATPQDQSLKNRLYDPIVIKKLVSPQWASFITLKSDLQPSKVRINWYAFELALFEQLEKELSVKNVWVDQSYRYCNPTDDLPADFDTNEDYYFNLLGLSKDPTVFIENLKKQLDESLKELNDSIIENPRVVIKKRNKKGAIKITPFDPQIEPQNLELLKIEVAKQWPSLHLIDILKETDFRIGFTKRFESLGSREAIPEDTLRKRLLLCVFGIGTNTGIKRMSSIADNYENYDNLLYVKKRFLTCQQVRAAIADVVNEIHKIRDPKVWGQGTTSCAADSTKMSVWDQNLLVEWHARYGGRGVMIYWHVDKKSLCIHSKLKSCSSSEVGAMIQGILQHDTLMDIDKISVDTHGQSSIGFAFSELLTFDLFPRIKNINKQKLYVSSKSKKEEYPNLTDALAYDSIKWSFIEKNYREMVRHAAALKVRTVDPEVMMKRLSADNKSNPIYQALLELGKASQTIFLCRYLRYEELRIEINEALNVVERVNGIMNFIFYGRLSEITSNKTNDQELSLLCLHLLQVCMCYINTILIQTVLNDPKWMSILTPEDLRALSPLFHAHINPYGFVALDMNTRLKIDPQLLRDAA